MTQFIHVWRMTCYEWFDALRSRRALVALLLYMATSLGTMYGSISLLQKIEKELVTVLQLPASENPGAITTTIWKSKHFQRMMRQIAKNKEVYDDIQGKNPIELIYAWLSFFYMPLLVVLIAANRIPEEMGSGAVRYIAFRTSRGAWVLGKFLGQVSLLALAVILSGLCAYLVARLRLGKYAPLEVIWQMSFWAIRAWVFSIPYVGLVMGLSLFTKSASKATIFAILALVGLSVITGLTTFLSGDTGWRALLPYIASLFPADYEMLLWRSNLQALLTGSIFLLTLGFSYLGIGFIFFQKRDL
jgi:ABC-type transport system involved in multi-copper enzyme maturation permease subunit